ncbi:acetolactate synthase, regulatory subunit, partial [Coemansia spiralis]
RESLLVKVDLSGQVGSAADAQGAEDAADISDAAFIATQERLRAVRQIADLFGGSVLDVGHNTVIVSLNAKSERIDAFLKLLRPFGVLEAVRSGIMAMPRSGSVSLFESEQSQPQTAINHDDAPDLSNLPPS